MWPPSRTHCGEANLDGWLLYDFHGSNPIAARLAGLAGGAHMTTRRWYYLIPADGQPRGLVHAIERHNLDQLPGDKTVYAGRQQLDIGPDGCCGRARVAMEYSPMCAIPYLSRVDAGTAEAVRPRASKSFRRETSSNSSRPVDAGPAGLRTGGVGGAVPHQGQGLRGRAAVREAEPLTEYDLQQQMVGWFEEEGLDQRFGAGGGGRWQRREIRTTCQRPSIAQGDLGRRGAAARSVGKEARPGAVFADITWVGSRARGCPARRRARSAPSLRRATRPCGW